MVRWVVMLMEMHEMKAVSRVRDSYEIIEFTSLMNSTCATRVGFAVSEGVAGDVEQQSKVWKTRRQQASSRVISPLPRLPVGRFPFGYMSLDTALSGVCWTMLQTHLSTILEDFLYTLASPCLSGKALAPNSR